MKRLVLPLGVALIFQSCAPSLSQYQTAATLGEGNKSSTLILEHTFDAASGPRQGSVDLGLGYMHTNGVTNNLDCGYGFGLNDHLHIAGGFHLKRSILKDKVSINFPVLSKYIDESLRADITPTLLYTYQSNNKFASTINLQYIIQLFAFDVFDNAIYLSHNWEIKSKSLYIYPEIGMQIGSGGDDFLMKYGLGFSLKNINQDN